MGYFYNKSKFLCNRLKLKDYPYSTILLLIYIFSLPFNNYIPKMPFLPFISVMVFFKFLILGILLIEIILKKRRFIEYKEYLILSFLVLIALFSAIWAEDVISSSIYILELFHVVILFFLITQIINKERLLRWIILVLVFSGLIVSLIGLWQYAHNPSERIASLIGDPNNLASFLIILIPLSFCMSKMYKNFKRLIFLFVGILMSLVVILTLSRGTFIALFVVFFLMFLKERKKILLLVLFLLIFLLCIPVIPTNFWYRAGTLFGLEFISESHSDLSLGSLGTIEQRAEFLVIGLRMFLDNFLFGVGIGNFKIRFHEYFIPATFGYGGANRVSHNMFLEIAAELGIFGLFVFLFLIWKTFKTLIFYKFIFSDDKLLVLIEGLNLSFIGFLVTSLFLSVEWNPYFWLLLSIIAALKNLNNQNKRQASE